MYRFFETIKIVNGIIQNPQFHQNRIDETLLSCYNLKTNDSIIDSIIVPDEFKSGLVKCRLSYDISEHLSSFQNYEIRKVTSLKLIFCDDIEYKYKYSDRTVINELLLHKEDCDDILIVKNGLMSDTSFSNIILFDGKKWLTPDTPLLNGTCRQRMLQKGRIEESRIAFGDLKNFQNLVLINAMRGEDLENQIPIESIK